MTSNHDIMYSEELSPTKELYNKISNANKHLQSPSPSSSYGSVQEIPNPNAPLLSPSLSPSLSEEIIYFNNSSLPSVASSEEPRTSSAESNALPSSTAPTTPTHTPEGKKKQATAASATAQAIQAIQAISLMTEDLVPDLGDQTLYKLFKTFIALVKLDGEDGPGKYGILLARARWAAFSLGTHDDARFDDFLRACESILRYFKDENYSRREGLEEDLREDVEILLGFFQSAANELHRLCERADAIATKDDEVVLKSIEHY